MGFRWDGSETTHHPSEPTDVRTGGERDALPDVKQAADANDEGKQIAKHCSEREQMAEEAEKLSVQIKLIGYYADLLWRGETGPLDGCVTGIMPKGLIVELVDTLQKGLVPFDQIDGDYFEINHSGTVARGSRTGREFRLGAKVKVLLSRVDTRNRRIDLEMADHGGGRKKSGKPGKRGKKPHGRKGSHRKGGGGHRKKRR